MYVCGSFVLGDDTMDPREAASCKLSLLLLLCNYLR
jgi:hypothetical protein